MLNNLIQKLKGSKNVRSLQKAGVCWLEFEENDKTLKDWTGKIFRQLIKCCLRLETKIRQIA